MQRPVSCRYQASQPSVLHLFTQRFVLCRQFVSFSTWSRVTCLVVPAACCCVLLYFLSLQLCLFDYFCLSCRRAPPCPRWVFVWSRPQPSTFTSLPALTFPLWCMWSGCGVPKAIFVLFIPVVQRFSGKDSSLLFDLNSNLFNRTQDLKLCPLCNVYHVCNFHVLTLQKVFFFKLCCDQTLRFTFVETRGLEKASRPFGATSSDPNYPERYSQYGPSQRNWTTCFWKTTKQFKKTEYILHCYSQAPQRKRGRFAFSVCLLNSLQWSVQWCKK